MTRILALDTSTEACSVALYSDGEVIENFLHAPREHTQRLLPAVDELLTRQKLSLADLDALAFGRGPGSFTGLRICMSTVQGLAFAADLPVIPVSTLLAMARGAWRQQQIADGSCVLAALDARMEQIYWGLFEVKSDEVVARSAEFVNSPADLPTHADLENPPRPLIGVGSGWHYQALQRLSPERTVKDFDCHAADIAAIAAAALQRGEAVSVLEAAPVYLRDEVSWKKRQRQRAEGTDLFSELDKT